MIAIKNFEMPKSCSECMMYIEEWDDQYCAVTWILLYHPEFRKERHKTCPLVEVEK